MTPYEQKSPGEDPLTKWDIQRDLWELLPGVVYIQGPDYTINYANRHFRDIFGEPEGRFCYQILQNREKPCPHCPTLAALKTGEPAAHKWKTPNGRVFYVHDLPYPSGESPSMVLKFGFEITENEKDRRKRQKSEDQFRRLFSDAVLGIFQSQPEGGILRVNPAFARMFGYDSPQQLISLVGDKPHELYARPALRAEVVKKILDSPEPIRIEVRHRRRDGSLFDAILHARTVQDEQGRLQFMEGFVEDISARKKAEREKYLMAQQLKQALKMEAIGTLAGGIAHDFNNILGAIMGYAEIALYKGQKGQTNTMECEQIIDVSEQAGQLIQQILTFSRRTEAQLRPVDLNQEVNQGIRLLRRTIPRMIDIKTDFHHKPLIISGDPAQLSQVVLNLGGNAKDAMPRGGELIIATTITSLDQDQAQAKNGLAPGEYALLSVKDTGHGFDEKTAAHIFDPFFTTKGSEKGTGLGLSTVYGIMKSHKGHVQSQSRPGEGALFRLYFPLLLAEQHKKIEVLKPRRPPEPDRQGDETILVVDDESAILETATLFLPRLGYQILTAASGEEALDIYRNHVGEIDLVILDVSMPGMGGYQCMQRLLELDPKAKVIMASGYAGEGHGPASAKKGAAGFLAKPYRFSQLLDIMRQVLDGPVD